MMTSNSNFVSDPIVAALLSEIRAKLAEIVVSGTTSRIDLRRLPLPAGGTAALRDLLGNGQVDASFRVVAVADPSSAERLVQAWRDLPGGEDAAEIGVVGEDGPYVLLETELGGERLVEELDSDPLPRIC